MQKRKIRLKEFYAATKVLEAADLLKIFRFKIRNTPFDIKEVVDYYENQSQLMDDSHTYIMISNLANMKLFYVSSSFKTITGYSNDEFMKRGFNFFAENYCPADRLNGILIVSDLYKHQQSLPAEERARHLYSSQFRFLCKDGNYKYFQSIFGYFSLNGNEFSHSVITEIDFFNCDNRIPFSIYYINHNNKIQLIQHKELVPNGGEKLNELDLKILTLLSNGLDNYQIANELGYTEQTIKDYREKMLKKTWCSNMSELICFALINEYI